MTLWIHPFSSACLTKQRYRWREKKSELRLLHLQKIYWSLLRRCPCDAMILPPPYQSSTHNITHTHCATHTAAKSPFLSKNSFMQSIKYDLGVVVLWVIKIFDIKQFLGWLTLYRLGWVEFYSYQTFKVIFVKIYFLDKIETFNTVCFPRPLAKGFRWCLGNENSWLYRCWNSLFSCFFVTCFSCL